MLRKFALLAAAGLMALGASMFAAPSTAEAGNRFVYSNNGVYLSFGHKPYRQYRRHAPRRHYYRHAPRRHYYRHAPRRHHYQQRRVTRHGGHCYRVERWARANTSDPKMQARILRRNGC
jgi:hypothetical protein